MAVKTFLLTHPVWDVTGQWSNDTNILLISTHTSRVGCDFFRPSERQVVIRFLLTHPVWDVTIIAMPVEVSTMYFYSHIPCGM